MAKFIRNFSILAVFIPLFLLFSCDMDGDNEPVIAKQRQNISITPEELSIVETQNEFSLKFYQEYAKDKLTPNFCISPLSLSMALSMLSNGAAGETLDEIIFNLGFEDMDMTAVNEFNTRLAKELCQVDNTAKVSLANSIWIDNSFTVNPDFIEDNKAAYNAEIFYENLCTEATKNKINKWCKDKTFNMIPEFLKEPLSDPSLALFNALYFKGLWATPFDKNNTSKKTFYNNASDAVQIDMMHNEIYTQAAWDNQGATWFSLLFGNGAFSLVVIVPDKLSSDALDDYIASLSSSDFKEMLLAMSSVMLTVDMPKFESRVNKNINGVLKNMGFEKLFGLECDLSRISDKISGLHVVQESVVKVDEAGAEAAAVTEIAAISSPGPLRNPEKMQIAIDRPFAYFIREFSTGSILFMGRVNQL